jgi:hypothetical protein
MRLQSRRAGNIGNSDENVAAPTRATRFVLMLEPLPGVDAIRALRFILKHVVRQHGMRAISIREVDPAADLSAGQSHAPPPAITAHRQRHCAQSETAVHRAVVAHLCTRRVPGLIWWHTPNGGRRNRIEAAFYPDKHAP